jgi:pyrroline-5-carboxylate reductase
MHMDTIRSLGFIGGGNMASAIIGGICRNEYLPPEKIQVYDPDADKTAALQKEWGIQAAEGIASLAAACDWVLLAVKPNIIPQVLDETREALGQTQPVVISIAAGVSLDDLESGLDPAIPIVRVMPNTPAMVGEGMSVLCGNKPAQVSILDTAVSLFRTIGKAVVMEEKYLDAVTAVSGSGPAYVCMFIEALADGGVREGLPRDTAYTLACQTVLGTARLIMDTNIHPGIWKDRVCSPGGTTIDAVRSLESGGFRATVMDAVSTCADKSRRLGKRA